LLPDFHSGEIKISKADLNWKSQLSNSRLTVHDRRKNVAKVVRATSTEGFLVGKLNENSRRCTVHFSMHGRDDLISDITTDDDVLCVQLKGRSTYGRRRERRSAVSKNAGGRSAHRSTHTHTQAAPRLLLLLPPRR